MHILLIEDDLDLGRALHSSLQLEGFSVQWLRRAADAPHQLDDGVVGCVLLDLSLPDGDGMALLAHWRRQGHVTPVIVITARMALHDRLSGLDNGADDFLVKPFAIPELVARIRAVLRRYAKQASEVWAIGALALEPKRHLCRLHGEPLDLSPREFQLLLELAREPGVVIAKGQLAQRLEPLGDAVEFSALEVHLSNLRRKIGADRIRTVRGVGYLLEA
ncbi:response regulator [Acidovorax sp. NCPPB 3576]|uniref:response regulator n=1 Tax=Acidovorax sp. NCPPB 3576 TaxID=2940488 RepID=UPI00234A924A|nr:response regulator [Acidovorax sp. NCPPB 3576]WCM87363.1 response regulator [Acidovorax sp. NCPPB 3576]